MNVVPQFDIELDDIAGSASRLPSNLIRNAKNLLETLADNFPAQHKMLASEVIKKSTGNRYAAEAEAWANVIGCDSDDILIVIMIFLVQAILIYFAPSLPCRQVMGQ